DPTGRIRRSPRNAAGSGGFAAGGSRAAEATEGQRLDAHRNAGIGVGGEDRSQHRARVPAVYLEPARLGDLEAAGDQLSRQLHVAVGCRRVTEHEDERERRLLLVHEDLVVGQVRLVLLVECVDVGVLGQVLVEAAITAGVGRDEDERCRHRGLLSLGTPRTYGASPRTPSRQSGIRAGTPPGRSGRPGVRSASGGADSIPLRRSGDRKSTRLNSSHVKISYAVFCLKKKKSE